MPRTLIARTLTQLCSVLSSDASALQLYTNSRFRLRMVAPARETLIRGFRELATADAGNAQHNSGTEVFAIGQSGYARHP